MAIFEFLTIYIADIIDQIGYLAGENRESLQQYWIYLDVFVILGLAALAAYVLYHKFMKKRPNIEA